MMNSTVASRLIRAETVRRRLGLKPSTMLSYCRQLSKRNQAVLKSPTHGGRAIWKLTDAGVASLSRKARLPRTFGLSPREELAAVKMRLTRAYQKFGAVHRVQRIKKLHNLNTEDAVRRYVAEWQRGGPFGLKVSERSLWRWKGQYSRDGLPGLVGKYNPRRHGRPLKSKGAA